MASWQILSSIEQKEEAKGNEQNVKRIKDYRQRVEDELAKICNGILSVIDKHLILSSTTGESTVFYYKMKGDYYHYLAELKSGEDCKEAAGHATWLNKRLMRLLQNLIGSMKNPIRTAHLSCSFSGTISLYGPQICLMMKGMALI